jgi:Cof subfamily protein (haloacid dehalogenase superfamily)
MRASPDPGGVPDPAPVRLVVADVDGTLVTPDKELTPRARAAVRALLDAGVAFTITSGRPPRGMAMLIEPLQLRDPIAAFNGGLLVRPNLSAIQERLIPGDVVASVVDILSRSTLDVWVYTDADWRLRSRHRPHVDREEWTVKFAPIVVSTIDDVRERVVKVVGVSDAREAIARGLDEVRRICGQQVSAALSQPYYLDVTHPLANKGQVVTSLSALLHVPSAQIATIGDMPNDVLMFAHSGVSIAMGNASPDVQRTARFVTKANTEEGFALAMERFVLGARAV